MELVTEEAGDESEDQEADKRCSRHYDDILSEPESAPLALDIFTLIWFLIAPGHQAHYAVRKVLYDQVKTVKAQVEDKQDELLQVALSNAIGDPSTMVVHAEDATAAFTTVMGPWRLDTITVTTVVHILRLQVVYLMLVQSELRQLRLARCEQH